MVLSMMNLLAIAASCLGTAASAAFVGFPNGGGGGAITGRTLPSSTFVSAPLTTSTTTTTNLFLTPSDCQSEGQKMVVAPRGHFAAAAASFSLACFLAVATTTSLPAPFDGIVQPALAAEESVVVEKDIPAIKANTRIKASQIAPRVSPEVKAYQSAQASVDEASAKLAAAQKRLAEVKKLDKEAQSRSAAALQAAKKAKKNFADINDELTKARSKKSPSVQILEKRVSKYCLVRGRVRLVCRPLSLLVVAHPLLYCVNPLCTYASPSEEGERGSRRRGHEGNDRG